MTMPTEKLSYFILTYYPVLGDETGVRNLCRCYFEKVFEMSRDYIKMDFTQRKYLFLNFCRFKKVDSCKNISSNKSLW